MYQKLHKCNVFFGKKLNNGIFIAYRHLNNAYNTKRIDNQMFNPQKDFDDTARNYLKSLKDYKALTKKEEHSLFKRYKENNDVDARNRLITSNLKYTCKIASNYRNRGLTFSELISEANQGLIDSIDKFDITQDVKFLSYSKWWIMQRIQSAIEKKGSLGKDIEYIENVNYEDGYDDNDVIDSVDDEAEENDFLSFNDEAERERRKRVKVVEKILDCLSKRERNIVKMYYGIGGEEKLNMEEIGSKLSITKERVRQIMEMSFKKMRTEALVMINN